MIWQPRIGQRVRLHYRASLRTTTPHGQCGVVVRVASGRGGPINVLVHLTSGKLVVVPRGQLLGVAP